MTAKKPAKTITTVAHTPKAKTPKADALVIAPVGDSEKLTLAKIDLEKRQLEVRKAELAILKDTRLTKGGREELTKLFHNRFRRKPQSQCRKFLVNAEVANQLQAEVKEMPEYQVAIDAVRALSLAVAAKYSHDKAVLSVYSSDTVYFSTSSSDSDSATDLVNVQRMERNKPIQEYNSQFEATEKKAEEARQLEQLEKLTVIKTAATREEVLRLVPECQVQLPTIADRELLAAGSWTPGELTATPQPAPATPAGEVTLEAQVV